MIHFHRYLIAFIFVLFLTTSAFANLIPVQTMKFDAPSVGSKMEYNIIMLSDQIDQQQKISSERTEQTQRQRRSRQGLSPNPIKRQIPPGVRFVPDIAYREGNKAWKLDLAMPKEQGDKPYPAIVFVHGGGWRGGDKRTGVGTIIEFATKGYVCITVNYRLLDEAPISACIEDVKCAVRWLRAHAEEYNVDTDRIGAYGNSAGAHLVAMLGLCPASAGLEGDGPWQDYSSMVHAVVSSATPTSFLVPMSDRQKNRQRREVSDRQTERNESGENRSRTNRASANSPRTLSEEMKKKISPMTYISADAPPFLLIHEESDQVVGVYHSDEFVKALREAGVKDVTYIRYEDGSGHNAFFANIKETGAARAVFFERTLKKKD